MSDICATSRKQQNTKHIHTQKKPIAPQICSKLRKESSDYTFIFNFFLIRVFCIISPHFINALLLLHMDTFFISMPLWVCKMVYPERLNSPAFCN